MKIRITTPQGTSQEKTVDVKAKFQAVWQLVETKARSKPCNEYFAKLSGKMTLQKILEKDITLHLLEPKPNFGPEVLPWANTAGRDIGLNPEYLNEDNPNVIACTLVHELAHVGGATTDPQAKDAHAAELALKSCGCANQYNKDTVGIHKRIELHKSGGSRLV